MTYNVENLFDTGHDKRKNDWEFLPYKTKGKNSNCRKIRFKGRRDKCLQTDWTNDKLKLKLHNIKRVVTRDGFKLPEILAVVEIENEIIAKNLADTLGYKKFIITNSLDRRGIDVALFFNEDKDIKFSEKYIVKVKELKNSRDILEVKFNINGQNLYIYVNHWPSQASPNKSRVIAAKALRLRIESIKSLDKNAYIIATGDFNNVDDVSPRPYKDIILSEKLLIDIDQKFRSTAKVKLAQKRLIPPGTYFYKNQLVWDPFDKFFVTKNFFDKKSKLKIDINSYQIVSMPFMQEEYRVTDKHYIAGSLIKGIPKRYNFDCKKVSDCGYSDHFPIIMNILINK